MRRCVWIFWLALLSLVAALPSQEKIAPLWQAVFDPQKGGLLQLLRHPFGDPRLTGMAIYTDWGILQAGRYEVVGSQNESNPKITDQRENNRSLVVVEGQLKDKSGKASGLRYRVRHRLREKALTLDIALQAERAFPSMLGFLATMFVFAGATEWFACTQRGWLFQPIASEGRAFQSAQTPLDPTNAVVGIANAKTGWALRFTLQSVEPKDALDNVIIHLNPASTGGVFFAWCDGVTERRMDAGEEWRLTVVIEFVSLAELIRLGE